MEKRNQDISYFVSFCLEQYKREKGISGSQVLNIFETFGVLDYIAEHFDIMHTQSRQWILSDIDEYINVRKKI